MRRQAATRSDWASFLVRCGFALTVVVIVPLVVTRSAFVVHRALAPASRPSELKKLLEFEREMERLGHPIHAAAPQEWPPQDLPINLHYDPLKTAPLFIHPLPALKPD
jgi:hypothetical protein